MAHINEKVDFTVEVFIVYKNKVLLRKHDKHHYWLSIGGHIELDEDPNQAAIREVKEEVGMDIELFDGLRLNDVNVPEYKELIPPYFLNRHRINENHEHVTLTYFSKSKTDKFEGSESEKSEDIKWFSKEELGNLGDIKPNVRLYGLKALEILSA